MKAKVLALRSFPLAIAALLFAAFAVLLTPLKASAAATAAVPSPFTYEFRTAGTLHESGSLGDSSSPYFWLNSGGKLVLESGIAKTVHGELPATDLWYRLYSAANALDTDGGAHPQNLFRLLTRSEWKDATMSVAFRVDDVILSDTPNRDGYSGILLMARYADSQNLYYAGIRQDGQAVIKRKKNGSYETLATDQVFGQAGEYDKDSNPNLIPEGRWMRLKVETMDRKDGSVEVMLYLDRENDRTYEKILSVRDSKSPLRAEGHAGIRTDYMDVSFDDLRIEAL